MLEEAIIYTTVMHQGKKRKLQNRAFILHPMEVAQVLSTMTDDEEVITAGILHDIVEDTDGTLPEIESRFGKRVAFLVSSESEKEYPELDPNPITLLHFKSLGLFVYASTDTIMRASMKRIGLNKFAYERIDIDEGDILKIDKNGNITRSQFQPAPKYSHFSSDKWWFGDECYHGEHEEMLFLYCNCFGVDTADVELLLEYGYTPSEVEEMLTDHSLLRETLREVKLMIGVDIYDDYCYRGVW